MTTDHYSDGRRWSVISQGWLLEECWTDKEEVAVLKEKVAALETLNAELVETLEDIHDLLEKGFGMSARMEVEALLAKAKEQA